MKGLASNSTGTNQLIVKYVTVHTSVNQCHLVKLEMVVLAWNVNISVENCTNTLTLGEPAVVCRRV